MAELKKVERSVHNFKEVGEVQGTLKEIVPNEFDGVDYKLDVEGKDVLVFGKTALMSKMKDIPVGKTVKIVYLGTKQSTKNKKYTYEDFDVYHD